MKNEFMELYKQLKENDDVAFVELKNFLKELTQQLTSEEAFELVGCLMSEEELIDYLN